MGSRSMKEVVPVQGTTDEGEKAEQGALAPSQRGRELDKVRN